MDTKVKGITGDFAPRVAIEALKDNAVMIEQYGQEIENKRLELVKVLAELMDAEEVARKEAFDTKIKISLFRDHIKLKTAKEQRKHDILKEEIKILENKKDIIIEINNSLKASLKVHEMEARNLSLNNL